MKEKIVENKQSVKQNDSRNNIKNGTKTARKNTKMLVTAAMLAGIAAVLMFFDFPVPFLPVFYKIDFSELPVLIGTFMMGPGIGTAIEAIKILTKMLMKGSGTAGVGEIANFLIGCSFILPAGFIYRLKKTKRGAIVGLCAGTVSCVIIGCLLNAFVLLPLYAGAFGGMENVIKVGTEANSAITDIGTLVIFATAPLNLIKCVSVSVITMLVYKPLSRFIKGN